MTTHATRRSAPPTHHHPASDPAATTPTVDVVCDARGCRLIAARPIRAGERVLLIAGRQTTQPSRYSVQVGEHLHIDVGEDCPAELLKTRHPWCYLNHSCEANTWIRGLEVVALRDIGIWDDVTFNYNTTEYRMASPFACACGASRCLGEIRGFFHLPAAERERLRPWLAQHLQRHMAPTSPGVPAEGRAARA